MACGVISRSGVVLGLMLASGLAVGVARADEDRRKLVDLESPVAGPIWRLGDSVARGGFDASGMTLLSQIPLNNFVGAARASGNDCWGYVSPSGREYAIMGLEGGFGFVEITNPTNPQIVEVIAGPSSLWHDVKVIGNIAYGVSEGGSGIQVMDMSNIDAGQVTLVRNWTSGGYSTTHNIVANTETGTLWVVGANIGNGGLVHISLNNPTLPAIDGGWTQMYVHDAQVVTWDSGAYAGRELAFCASGFDGGFTQTGLRVVDVTNPNAPAVIATLFYPSAAYSHQVWMSEDQKYLYLNDELDEGNAVSVTTTRIINIENPAAPYFAGTTTSGRPAIDHNLYTRNGLMFQANYRSGLRVFDILDPASPTQIAYFDTYPNDDAAEFNGAWSNYPFFPSGTILISDIERGLFMVRLDVEPSQIAVSLVGSAPAQVDPAGGETLTLKTTIREASNAVASVTLFVDSGSGYQAYPATANGDGTYSADMPAVACGSDVRAYFRAVTTEGDEAFYPAGGSTAALAFDVVSDETTTFADTFQTNQGWTVSGGATNAAAGRWERAIPGGDGSRGDPATDADGSGFCYVTGNGGPGSNTDVDAANTILTSPALNATAETGDAQITYARWFSNTAGAAPGADVFTVQISGNGSAWTTVEVVGPTGPQSGGGWYNQTIRVADYITPTAQVRLRFIAEDAGDGSVIEAGVDAVDLTFVSCTDPVVDCPADLDGNGVVNFFDVSAFLAFYNAQNPAADINNDGVWNFFDVSAYLAQYNAGCP